MGMTLLVLTIFAGLFAPHLQTTVEFSLEGNGTFWEGLNVCKRLNGYLVTFVNKSQNNEVLSNFSSKAEHFWIGLHDDLKTWTWSLSGAEFHKGEDFSNWYLEQFISVESKICVSVGPEGTWKDQMCTEMRPAVCYYEPGPANYILVTTPMTWEHAQEYCRSNYTDLASVRNQAENYNITALLTEYSWIGLSRDGWSQWSDNNAHNFTNFEIQHSDSLDTVNSNTNFSCAMASSTSGLWSKVSCSSNSNILCYFNELASTEPVEFSFEGNGTFWEGQDVCKQLNGSLVTFVDKEENDEVLRNFSSNGENFWIGLHDDLSNWTWSLDGAEFHKDNNFSDWLSERFITMESKICVTLSPEGKWKDRVCTDMQPAVCYNESGPANYILVTTSMTWDRAQEYCRSNHTDLASVRNQTESNNITALLTEPAWIGLSRVGWSQWSNNIVRSFTNFEIQDNLDTINSNANFSCAMANSTSGLWSKVSCSSNSSILCRFNVSKSGAVEFSFEGYGTFWKAQDVCKQLNGSLVTFVDKAENDEVLRNFSSNGEHFWIGLRDDLSNWTWSLHEAEFHKHNNYSNWLTEKFITVVSKICVTMEPKGNWSDTLCTDMRPAVCYNESGPANYILVTTSMTWDRAQEYCRSNHTDLASVRNQTESNNITALLTEPAWIGLSRVGWSQWSDNIVRSFTNFEIPDNLETINSSVNFSCAMANSTSGLWSKVSCWSNSSILCRFTFTGPLPIRSINTLKLRLQSDIDLKDPGIQDQLLQQLHEHLDDYGLTEFKLRWTQIDQHVLLEKMAKKKKK